MSADWLLTKTVPKGSRHNIALFKTVDVMVFRSHVRRSLINFQDLVKSAPLVLDAAEGSRRWLTAGAVQPGDRSTFCMFWV